MFNTSRWLYLKSLTPLQGIKKVNKIVELLELHDNIMFYLVIILFSVGWIMISIVRNYNNVKSPISHKYLNHGTLIELIWTITPALI